MYRNKPATLDMPRLFPVIMNLSRARHVFIVRGGKRTTEGEADEGPKKNGRAEVKSVRRENTPTAIRPRKFRRAIDRAR